MDRNRQKVQISDRISVRDKARTKKRDNPSFGRKRRRKTQKQRRRGIFGGWGSLFAGLAEGEGGSMKKCTKVAWII